MKRSIGFFAATLALASLLLSAAGCSSLNDDVASLSELGVAGSWSYTVNNATGATFVDCTGDATVLEGRTFVDSMALAPICIVGSSFEVIEEAGAFAVIPHDVACSDGSTAAVAGGGIYGTASVTGQWDSVSSSGVTGLQSFTGTVLAADRLRILEDARSFSGSFEGSCGLDPPLSSTVEIR